MFDFEIQPAKDRLDDAIKFKRKGGGFFFPDTLTDTNAITLSGVHYHPTTDWDEVILQFANVAWCENLEPYDDDDDNTPAVQKTINAIQRAVGPQFS